ncbi:MAG TPA: sugar phosphate isomerase/epimerase family protein [Candidatus Udaeobacter sp.]|nr:sugar phosphate isomerase/epimerase family protein [Candidatus Udaeobacter sp.]
MKLGIHAYAWCSQWSNDTLHLINRVKDLGLDFIELPLMSLDTFDVKAVRGRLQDIGLECCTSTVLLEGMDLTSDDAEERQRAVSYLKQCVEVSSGIGAKQFSGVIYSQHVKTATKRPSEKEWQMAADGLREVAKYAETLGVPIALEPVNRYETYLINTSEQAMKLIDMIGMDNVGVHLDTYHMNIEEKRFSDAVQLAGPKLMHIHLCENDRGIPGTGLVNWDDLFRTLGEINYEGYAALESFVDITDNMSTWVWRQLAPNGDVLITEGKTFIRSMQEKYGLV